MSVCGSNNNNNNNNARRNGAHFRLYVNKCPGDSMDFVDRTKSYEAPNDTAPVTTPSSLLPSSPTNLVLRNGGADAESE